MNAAALDLALQRAWPAGTMTPIGPWTARLDAGVTRRANSVLTHGPGSDLDDATLDALLNDVIQLYTRHGLPPWLQLTGATWPPRLGERLDERGWQTGMDPTLLLTGLVPTVGRHGSVEPEGEIVLTPRPSQDWLTTWGAVDGRGGDRELEAVEALLARLEHAAFASVVEAGSAVGVGLGVLVGSTLVFECLATTPTARRRGVATRVMTALGQWASEHGALHSLLAVLANNASALRLYDALGFDAVGTYSYARPAPSDPREPLRPR